VRRGAGGEPFERIPVDQAADLARAVARARQAGVPVGAMLMDPAYGSDARLRTGISELGRAAAASRSTTPGGATSPT